MREFGFTLDHVVEAAWALLSQTSRRAGTEAGPAKG